MTTDDLISVPTIDGSNTCYAAVRDGSTRCAYFAACQRPGGPTACSSGVGRVFIYPDQLNDYLAIKLVS